MSACQETSKSVSYTHLGRDSEAYLKNPQLLREICDLASPYLYERIMDNRIAEDESWQLQLTHAITEEIRVIRFTIKPGIVIADKRKYMFYWEDITSSVRAVSYTHLSVRLEKSMFRKSK